MDERTDLRHHRKSIDGLIFRGLNHCERTEYLRIFLSLLAERMVEP